jgi:hypothetical protein
VDSRAVVHPIGPLPPRVYWTRRAVLLAALALIIVVIAVSCSGGSGGGNAAPTPTRTRSPGATTPTVALLACSRDQLDVTAETDADKYAAGTLPRLTVVVSNTGATACTLTESPRTRSWTIVSGPDQVWTTAGCPAPATAQSRTLAPGKSVRRTIVWNRHRSGKKCTTSTVEAAPGTYQLTVTVNGLTSGTAVFHLTG